MQMDVLDSQWVDEYRSHVDYVSSLEPGWRAPIAAQKAAFFEAGCQINPDLRPDIDIADLREHQEQLVEFQERIGSTETEEVVRSAYVDALGEQQQKLLLIGAASMGDTSAFIEAGKDLYQDPDPKVFCAVSSFVASWAYGAMDEHHGALVTAVANEVTDMLSAVDSRQNVWLNDSEFMALKEMFGGFFDRIMGDVELPEVVRGEQALRAARLILSNLEYPYEVVPQARGVAYMEVKHPFNQVRIPLTGSYQRDRFIALMGHEIGVHVEERIQGEAQPLKLAAVGLDRFIRAGEGKGTLVEQVSYPDPNAFMQTPRFFDLARRCLSVGLARGMDGSGERDFAEVFNTLNAVDYLRALMKTPGDPDRAFEVSRNSTWALLATRSLRGWNGRGSASLKEKDYLEGSLKQGRLLLDTPGVYPFINLGKFDLTRRSHVNTLRSVGTLPAKSLLNI